MRGIGFAALWVLASVAWSQGGGIGGGGGFQGGNANFTADSEEVSRTLFLSPGDRTEWTFDAKENESILVRVTSSVFDPAVAIEDDKGKKIAQNDDLEPGNQMSQLVLTVPKAGAYKVVITNYKGTAGGPFSFYARRFLSVPIEFDKPVVADIGGKRTWVRIDLPQPGDFVVSARVTGMSGRLAIMRPNGQPQDNALTLNQDFGYVRQRFHADEPGMFYIGGFNADKPSVRFAPVLARDFQPGDSAKEKLGPDAVVDYRIKTKGDQVLSFAIDGNPDNITQRLFTPTNNSAGLIYTNLREPGMQNVHVTASVRDFQFQYSVYEASGKAADCTVVTALVGKALPASGKTESTLGWFGSEFWTFHAKPGDVVKLRASSPTYTVGLQLLEPNGAFRNVDYLGKTPEVGSTIQVGSTGQFVAAISGGGIGAYKLSTEVIPPRRLSVGTATSTLKAGTPDVWRLSAKKGQDFVFRITSPKARWMVTLMAPNGDVLQRVASDTGVDSDLVRIKPDQDGDYTVILEAVGDTSGDYTLKLVDLG